VVLVEGSVAIDVANGESVTLNPSERFSMKDGSYSVYEVDPYKYISWKDGLLFFTSNTLFEVLQKVAAFYKIEITCSGEIGSRKCTGKLILFDDLTALSTCSPTFSGSPTSGGPTARWR